MRVKDWEKQTTEQFQEQFPKANPEGKMFLCDALLNAIDKKALAEAGYEVKFSDIITCYYGRYVVPSLWVSQRPNAKFYNPYMGDERDCEVLRLQVTEKRKKTDATIPVGTPQMAVNCNLIHVQGDSAKEIRERKKEDLTTCIIKAADSFFAQTSKFQANAFVDALEGIAMLYEHGLSIKEAKTALQKMQHARFFLGRDNKSFYGLVSLDGSEDILQDMLNAAATSFEKSNSAIAEEMDMRTKVENVRRYFNENGISKKVDVVEGKVYLTQSKHHIDSILSICDKLEGMEKIIAAKALLSKHHHDFQYQKLSLEYLFEKTGYSGCYVQIKGDKLEHGEFKDIDEVHDTIIPGAIIYFA